MWELIPMMRRFKYLASIVFLLQILSSLLFSQIVEPKFDAFPAAVAQCCHQDSFGFMWIGTHEGLLRYDGLTIKQYSHIPFDSTSLSNNWVFDIAEDRRGNLWVATFGGGLNYFDQRTELFRHFSGTSGTIENNFITKLIVDDDGSLWFSSLMYALTHLKLDDYGNPQYTHYTFFDEPVTKSIPTKNSALTLCKDKQGLIWIGMATAGLIRFDPRTGDTKNFQHDPQNPLSISNNTISAICEDDSGNIWIGTGHANVAPGGGLNMFNRKTEEFKHFRHDRDNNNSICSDNLTALLIDHDGVMWIGTLDSFFDTVPIRDLLTKGNPSFKHHKNLPKRSIISIYEDKLGNIWFGVFMAMQGYKMDRQQYPFSLFSRNDNYPNSLTRNSTACVFVDHFGRIWFNTDGLDMYDPAIGKFKHYYHNQNDTTGLSENMISSIQETADGKIWIGTPHNGINILNPSTENFEHIRYRAKNTKNFHSNAIEAILARKNGDLWIASKDIGIQLYEKKTGKFHTFVLDPETNEDFMVNNLFEDRLGVLWIGTYNAGIYSLSVDENHASKIRRYSHDPQNSNSLSSNTIGDILQLEIVDTSALWIATDGGLNRFDFKTKTFKHFYREDGLPSNYVLQILEDDEGNLWLSTTKGLSVFRIRTHQFKTYGKGDGVHFTSFWSLPQTSAKGPDGRLYFAGGDGVLGFQPREILENPNIPPVWITDLKMNYNSVKLDTAIQFKKTLKLTHRQNAFSLEFTALNFTNSGKNQFKYKMERLLDDWIYIGNERTASFTNLDPGEYIFRVKGSNNHGVWNEKDASVRIIITPPWWRTGWAYFSYTLLIGSLLFGTARFEIHRRQRKMESQLQREKELRELQEAEHRAVIAELQSRAADARKEKEKEQMRSHIASDLHDEIGGNLSSIALISQVLEDKYKVPKPMKLRLREIPRIARLTAESMRDIVWFINPENDNWDKLPAKMRETANLMLESIDFTFTAPKASFTFETDLDFRRNLYLFYKECLQNIIKHSRADKVEIRIGQEENRLHLQVFDNGVGFDTAKEYSGNGLKNLCRRAADMGGAIKIVSENGKGAKITLVCKRT
jgi:ligand-binding sensor domain-containing protein/signal transduction histidine kinase